MTEEKDIKQFHVGTDAVEKLFEAFEEEQLPESIDIKSIEFAMKKVELELKNIRKVLKYYRKKGNCKPTLLKG